LGLVDVDVDVDDIQFKTTALHLAAGNNQVAAVQLLLDHGAYIHSRGDQVRKSMPRMHCMLWWWWWILINSHHIELLSNKKHLCIWQLGKVMHV
jgi:ankyrin repeat protein